MAYKTGGKKMATNKLRDYMKNCTIQLMIGPEIVDMKNFLEHANTKSSYFNISTNNLFHYFN